MDLLEIPCAGDRVVGADGGDAMSKISDLRQIWDMSLRECAEEIGIAPQVLSNIERGKTRPTDELIIKMAEVLQCKPEVIKSSLPTDEEVAKEAKKWEQFLEAVAALKADASARGFKRGNGGAGEIVCPVDGGRLRYSVAGCNGHMMAACSNQGCVRFVE